jgi:hypothetical protein
MCLLSHMQMGRTSVCATKYRNDFRAALLLVMATNIQSLVSTKGNAYMKNILNSSINIMLKMLILDYSLFSQLHCNYSRK